MKILFTIIISTFFAFGNSSSEGCNKEKTPDWVKEMMDRKPKLTQITKCSYNDDYVWKVNTCVSCHDMITKVYDRNKNVVCQYGGVLRQNTCVEEGIDFDDCHVIYQPKLKITLGL